ncbi:hypothetical protein BDQ12DRAFT_672454 [Crucibulum laeve]|uniref:Uncharacterized protein n=1 Tax=Crucibulum laeve TaxID=68775 RepID=A0A5C3MFE4_9AGAR|nr:hypothetical protein BDQ12DRAFT_672454 [Crucibulum laeve]
MLTPPARDVDQAHKNPEVRERRVHHIQLESPLLGTVCSTIDPASMQLSEVVTTKKFVAEKSLTNVGVMGT